MIMGCNNSISFMRTGQKPPGHKPPDKSPPDKKPPNNEIIIQSYYICFILVVIIKDILKN